MLSVKLLEKKNRKGGKAYSIYYVYLPRKLIDAIGLKNNDRLWVKIVMHEGKQAILLYPLD